ncbi:DMT family transporter [Aquibium sp. LZ166]|uniref:DMT family transporter n=1 Tax=Aquibium pacificus TaxID=3153579 RepID=A0ABV3SEX8_9HYPH
MNEKSAATRPMSAVVWAQLLLLGAIWGGSFFFARIAVEEIAPFTLVLLRVAIAAAALHVYLLARGISFAPTFLAWRGLLLLGAVNNVVPFSLMFLGQTEIGAGLASVLNATTPFWTIIVASFLVADEKITSGKLAGIALGIAGTAVMIGPGLLAGLGGPVWAKLALIGTALSYAFAFVVAKRITGLSPTLIATGQLTASSVIMVPIVVVLDDTSQMLTASAQTWSAVLGLALLSTAFAYILYFRILASAGATNASLVTLIVPVSALLLGILFLGERLEAFEAVGIGLIGCGLLVIDGRAVTALRRRRRGLPARIAAPEPTKKST